jgi:hypothetical protein
MYNRDFHKSIENDEYPQAVRVGEYISTFLKPSSFLDFGCSTGLYLREVQSRMPTVHAIGFEFSQEAVESALCKNIFKVDLTEPVQIERRPNTLGLCLEVLEHIEDRYWEPVLENMTKSCDKIIFSAAVPGQGGVGHINCRPKIDWINRFHKLGWVVDLDSTKHLLQYMQSGYHMGWFTNNVMILTPYTNCTC